MGYAALLSQEAKPHCWTITRCHAQGPHGVSRHLSAHRIPPGNLLQIRAPPAINSTHHEGRNGAVTSPCSHHERTPEGTSPAALRWVFFFFFTLTKYRGKIDQNRCAHWISARCCEEALCNPAMNPSCLPLIEIMDFFIHLSLTFPYYHCQA